MDISGFALVTGAASGIGKACAKTFARDCATGIALLDLNEQALLTVKAEIDLERTKCGGKPCIVEVYPVDVTNEVLVDDVVNIVAKRFGRLDYVVNAAGIGFKHSGGAAFAATKDWQRVLDVNLNGTFYVLRSAAKIMLKQEPIRSIIDGRSLQRGSIVNFASILGAVGVPLSTAYTASKHGVLGLNAQPAKTMRKMACASMQSALATQKHQ